jgi:hypothetical protein
MWSGGVMNKVKKLERNRYSILTDNMDQCYLCGKRKQHLHEIFFGRNRQLSMKYGCVVPLCFSCHEKVHNNYSVDLKLKQECQKRYMDYYEVDEEAFIKTFRNNYLRK